MTQNTIYLNDDHDLYCQFCDENVLSLAWKKHIDSEKHNYNRAVCNRSKTNIGLFCKNCGFLMASSLDGAQDGEWCFLAEDGKEGLILGQEMFSNIKEAMRLQKCINAGFGHEWVNEEYELKRLYQRMKEY